MLDTIIIGAGVSGLSAAVTLQQAGKNVLVLEARSRLGGRILTDRSLGLPIDLGASWLHGLSVNPLTSQVDSLKLKLTLYESILDDLAEENLAFFDQNGRRLTHTQVKMLQVFANVFIHSIQSLPSKTNLLQILAETYQASGLAKTLPGGDLWLAGLLTTWDGDDVGKVSVEAWRNLDEFDNQQGYVVNGYDNIIVSLLENNIPYKLNQVVTAVEYASEKVRIITNQEIFTARQVICTVPIGILKQQSICFQPALPAKKQEAINKIGCGILNKVVLKFPHCFWHPYSHSLQQLPKNSSTFSYYANYMSLLNQPVLVALYGGDFARELETLSDQKIVEHAIAPLQSMYPKEFVMPTATLCTRWWQDPYARCGYSYLAAGQTSHWSQALAEPVEDKVFFAGEATSSLMIATVHGAYMSGIETAKLCLEKL